MSSDPTGATKAPTIVSILVLATVLSTSAVILRVITRLSILGAFGLDDWAMVLAQIFCIGLGVVMGFECHYGLGRHLGELDQEHIIMYFKFFYASLIVYNAALSATKVSIILQCRRIFPSRGIQRASLALLVFIVLWGIVMVCWMGMICIPVDKFWFPDLPGRCAPLIPSFYVPAAVNIFTDFATFILPIPALKTLKLPSRQKIILLGIFGIGFFTCAISLIRLYTLKIAANTQDSSWDNVDAALWSYLEVSTGILAGSLPTLRPLLSKLFPGLLGPASQASPSKGYGPNGHSRKHSIKQHGTEDRDTSTDALHGDIEYALGDVSNARFSPCKEGYVATVVREEHPDPVQEPNSRGLGNTSNRIIATTTTIVTQEVRAREMEP